jgi:3-oxoacyl-ACP reductase-like protein
VLRKVFGTKREEVTGEWKRLHNEELYGLHSSPNIIKKNVMTGTCNTYWDRRDAQVVLVGKLRPLGRSRRRWKDNIKMALQDAGCGSMEWIDLAGIGTVGGLL